GDEYLSPGIQPDILLRSTGSSGRADNRRRLVKMAAALSEQLREIYRWKLRSDHPEIITRRRATPQGDYIFIVNDRRTYGNYIGHHRLVMEKGLPSSGKLTLNGQWRAIYDLVHRKEVPFHRKENE